MLYYLLLHIDSGTAEEEDKERQELLHNLFTCVPYLRQTVSDE